jgi:transposase
MRRFQAVRRNEVYLLPPAIQDWLPERHLARFVVDIVDVLDLSEIERTYGNKGTEAYHPSLLLSLIIYGYATGVFSSRKLERATYDSVAFRFIAGDVHPDHDTFNTFRKRFLKQIQALMLQVLVIARNTDMLKFGNIALDGSKIKANASKHSALSYGHIQKQEAQLKTEIAKLMALAEAADNQPIPDGMDVPAELTRREDRLAAIGLAKAKIEERAQQRYAQEQADYANKIAKRAKKAEKSGKPPRGKPPVPPVAPTPEAGARDKDQVNLTDEQSRMMKTSGGGFEQCYNGQLAVDMESMLIVATNTVQAANDKQQVEPMLNALEPIAKVLGVCDEMKTATPITLVADTGLFSEANVSLCVARGVSPLIAVKREEHHPDPIARYSEASPLKDDATPLETMRHRLQTIAGRALYAQRKCTVEPVIGIIKSVMGFRQFSLRGLDNVKGELNLVALAWNLKRMFVLKDKIKVVSA